MSQLRLRDIGGIIVIDFIDMARGRNRDAVLKMLRKSLDEDRTKTYVVEISPLGLVEMTRQNVTDGVREIMTKPCPVCVGEGVVLSEETVAIEVDRSLRDLVADGSKAPAFLIRVNPKVAAILVGRPRGRGPDPRDRAGDRQALPLRGHRGAADRPLRGRARGHARGGRGARAPVPRGRGGARAHRGAAHVQRGRRGREAGRLRRLGVGRGDAGGREDAGADREGGPKRCRGVAGQPARGRGGELGRRRRGIDHVPGGQAPPAWAPRRRGRRKPAAQTAGPGLVLPRGCLRRLRRDARLSGIAAVTTRGPAR